jgi:hypothetical protein
MSKSVYLRRGLRLWPRPGFFLLLLTAGLVACQSVVPAVVEVTAVPLRIVPTEAAVTPPPPMIQPSPLAVSAADTSQAADAVAMEADQMPETAIGEASASESGDIGIVVLGESVEGRPVTAYRHGHGPWPILLVGETGAAAQELLVLHAWLTAEPALLPPELSLWLLPNWNPDGRDPASPFNAHNVHLHANAGRAPNGCTGQPAGGLAGPFPFSEPESRALRSLAEQMWLVLFWQTGGVERSVTAAGCATHQPSQALADWLAADLGYQLLPAGAAAGNWGAYLAQRDTAVASVRLGPDCAFACQQRLLLGLAQTGADFFAGEAAAAGGSLTWIGAGNSGLWQFAPRPFIHPLSVSRDSTTIYLLDSGQVWGLPLADPAAKWRVLGPGDLVDGVVVQEPVDLALIHDELLVLDRVGDVYRCAVSTAVCQLERYDRPVGATSSHFYLSLSGSGSSRYLLETSYAYVLGYDAGQSDRARPLPDILHVGVAAYDDRLYVLSRGEQQSGSLTLYNEQGRVNVFRPNLAFHRPRQVVATTTAVYVLDQGGHRLLQLHPDSGRLQAVIRLRTREKVSSFTVAPDGRLLLATPTELYFVGEPAIQAVVNGPEFAGLPPHHPVVLYDLVGLVKPITGSPLTQRPLHLPGAPRHYRLGVHEGLDFYWQTGTPVQAITSGIVLRVDLNYVAPDERQFALWREESHRLTYTSEAAHDGYRGRQVWLQHGNGMISRYAHLDTVAADLRVGTVVSQGQFLGTVGNSGSPLSLDGPDGDAHLHLEIWLGDRYLGQYLRPVEIMEWLEEIFP